MPKIAVLRTGSSYQMYTFHTSRFEFLFRARNFRVLLVTLRINKESPPVHPVPEASLGVLRTDSHALRAAGDSKKKLIHKDKSRPGSREIYPMKIRRAMCHFDLLYVNYCDKKSRLRCWNGTGEINIQQDEKVLAYLMLIQNYIGKLHK